MNFFKITNYLITALIFVTATTNIAQASELSNELTEIIKSRIAPLDREVITFHYQSNPANIQNQNDLEKTISQYPGLFYNAHVNSKDLAGPGLYAAVDPIATRAFGWSNPQLYVIAISAKTRIFDATKALTEKEIATIKKINTQFSCSDKQYSDKEYLDVSFLNLLRMSSSKQCRDLIVDIFKELDIQAILYNYMGATLEDCRQRSVAFNIISNQVINYDQSSFFNEKIKIDLNSTGPHIKQLYNEALQMSSKNPNQSSASFSDLSIPQHLSSEQINENTYEKWKEEKIYKCGEPWMGEVIVVDRIMRAMNLNFTANYASFEISKLLADIQIAFIKKRPTDYKIVKNYSNALDIKKISKLFFLSLGFSNDKNLFKKWLSFHDNPTAFLTHLGLSTVENPKASQIDLNSLLENAQKTEIKDPLFYYKALRKGGYSHQYALLLLNDKNFQFGGIPLLNPDLSRDIKIQIKESEAIYKKALTECLEMYSNEIMSYEKIQKSDCEIL